MKATIMNAQGEELTNMLGEFLQELDNYEQVASDAGDEDIASEICATYNEIEISYFNSKENKEMDPKERNNIRIAMKAFFKQVGVYNC